MPMSRKRTVSQRSEPVSRARPSGRLWASSLAAFSLLAMALAGCADRVVGQVELLTFDSKGQLQRYARADTPPATRPRMIPEPNDPVRSNDDVITIVVESAYIQNLPFRLTKSNDVIIFADVWENAAEGFNAQSSLTSIVYVGPNQKVPGRLNLRDMLAYGPTKFKGHPLRIRFTMMVLQKAAAQRQSSAIDVISSFASVAAPQYSMISSQVAKLLQGILRAQPDIKFFDFDVTFFSDKPEGLVAIVPPTPAGPSPAGPGPAPAAPPPAGTLQPTPGPGVDTIHWLRYGRYALVETEAHDGTTTIINLQPSDVSSDDAWLRIPSKAPLGSSYVVFRVLPGQLAEGNDVLRAASDANVKLLESLRRSDAEINAALDEIKASATSLQDQVLRSRAESIAYKVFRDAQVNKQTDCTKIGDRFDGKWKDETASITDETRKAAVTKIGESVKKRWLEKCEAAKPAA